MKTRTKKTVSSIVAYTLLILVGISFALPTLWMILSAFDPLAIPTFTKMEYFTLDNFKAILADQGYVRGFANSLIYSCSVVAIVVVCSIFGAYPLSRYGFRKAENISLSLLFLASVPTNALIIPVYKLFSTLHILNHPISLILFQATCSLPHSIWMMKNFFDSIPKDLEEAAWTDGASSIQSILHIIVPLMLPGIITIAIRAFISSWSSFMVPYILLNNMDTLPASVVLYNLFDDGGQVNYGHLAAYSMLYMAPVVALYTISQNWMSKGYSMGGANKG